MSKKHQDKKFKKLEKKRAKQRAKQGFADIDVWNHYDWFIYTARRMLKQLKKEHMGFPPDVLSLANQNRLAFGTEEEKKYYSGKGARAWEDILDRMIFLLYEMDEEKCSQKNEYQESFEKYLEKKHPEKHEGYQDIRQKYYDREKEISQYRNKCKNDFFKLYSKWFWSLWD